MTFISDIGTVDLCDNHIINVSSDLIEPFRGFDIYIYCGVQNCFETYSVDVVSVKVSYDGSEFCCNEVITLSADHITFIQVPFINIDGAQCTPSSTSTVPDTSLCPTISVTSTYLALTSTVSVSPSPSSSYSSSHITHSSSVTFTFFTSSMPPNPSSIISLSAHPTHAPSLTSYSSATTDLSFSFSPTISPSPLLCPTEDSQWQETAAGQNATGTCYKGTFNGQFDHLCHTLYLSFH